MTDAVLRIGLVGYGFGGRYFHAPLIASAPGCVLVGVVTRSPDRRAEVAQDHPGVAVYDSIDDLVGGRGGCGHGLDSGGTHTALTEELLRRGLPVVCDKPFAWTRRRPGRRWSWPSVKACCSARTRTVAGTPTC